jgi:hypothetical protein
VNLRQLLDDGARFDAEYQGGLSNHLPMALCALKRLGAKDARLASFAELYAQRLVPAPSASPWPAGAPWAERLGDLSAWPAYRSLFHDWLVAEGTADVLEQALPRLMAGCGASAFHGLIRTAYAVQSGHGRELADGLAYWACRWLPLGEAPANEGSQPDPAAVLARLPAPATQCVLIVERMTDAARLPGFSAAVSELQIDEQLLHRLAAHAAMSYANSSNFVLLHLLTSAHALRVLMPFCTVPLVALRHYWRAYAAAYAARGAVAAAAAGTMLPWDELIAAALASNDEHVIKLVYSCREEQAAYGGDAWQRAASRVAVAARC